MGNFFKITHLYFLINCYDYNGPAPTVTQVEPL